MLESSFILLKVNGAGCFHSVIVFNWRALFSKTVKVNNVKHGTFRNSEIISAPYYLLNRTSNLKDLELLK